MAQDKTLPHAGHAGHLCYLVNVEFHRKNKKDYRELVKDARFLCRHCGRAAASARNLCNPVRL